MRPREAPPPQGIHGDRRLAEDDGIVALDASRTGAAAAGVEPMLDCCRRRLNPFPLDTTGRTDSRLVDALALCRHDIEGDDVFAVNTPRLARQRGAVTAGEQKAIADTRPALRKAIGIAGEERMTQRLVGDVRRNIAAERVRRNPLQFRARAPAHLTHPCAVAPLAPIDSAAQPLPPLRRTATIDQDPGKPRMKGNALQLPAERRDARADAVAVDRPEPVQQTQRRMNPIGRRRFEPFERHRIRTPREQIEDRSREIDSCDLRLAMRPQSVAGTP